MVGTMSHTSSLWLVRHGATDWSTAGRLTGWTDVPLNAEGQNQAASLRSTLRPITFAGVWSSDLTRAVDTARLAWGEAHIDRRLREINFGTLEGTLWDHLDPALHEALLGFDDFQAPHGESTADLRERVADFLSSIPAGDNLIFTHGGVIRLLLRVSGQNRHIQPGELIRINPPHLQP